jgi:hypothetical protein
MADLSDSQWCFLDILVRARRRGITRVHRHEILNSGLPDTAKVQLVFGGLLIANSDLVAMHGAHEFEITERGLRAYNTRFGKGEAAARPSHVADLVIPLPDRSMERMQ